MIANITSENVARMLEGVTPVLPPRMAILQKWRNSDHEDFLTLSRSDVVLLIEETLTLEAKLAEVKRENEINRAMSDDNYQKLQATEARVAKLTEALIWCSGSDDFQDGGKAREGWLKLCAPLIQPAALQEKPHE